MKKSSKIRIKIKQKTLNRRVRLLVCFCALIILSLWFTSFNSIRGESSSITSEYTIQKGDNLWNIAEKINKQNMDTREVVYEIKLLNGMSESSMVEVGQQLILPVY